MWKRAAVKPLSFFCFIGSSKQGMLQSTYACRHNSTSSDAMGYSSSPMQFTSHALPL